ncbi:hypothetical protein Tco_0931772, partial [Tanacetum coccineum]
PTPQPQALETTFKARVRDYIVAHTKRMERFKNAIFKQREEINDRMTEMFGLLKELTTSKAPEKVLIREGAKSPVTINVNSISLVREEEEENDKHDIEISDNDKETDEPNIEVPVKEAKTKNRAENGVENKPIKKLRMKKGPVYDTILKKDITKKEDIGGNFKIPYSTGGLKHVNALVDQGSDVNVMPYSTYMKLTDERPAETDIRLSLASHSYIYPLGISEDVLVEATIKFDKGTITLRSGKNKVSFHRIPNPSCMTDKGVKNDIEPISPTMTVNRLVLEWEERIRLHQEKEIEFDQWRSKNFKDKHPALTIVKEELEDKGEVT